MFPGLVQGHPKPVYSSSVRGVTFGADETPADVDMLMVLDAASWSEVVRADDAVVGQNHAAGRHAQVCGVVRDRTANAPHQPT